MKSVTTVLSAVALTFIGQAHAVSLTSYDADAAWYASVSGPATVIDFESFADGTVISNQLTGISSVTASSPIGVAVPTVGRSDNLPFPMFTPGTLASETNFLSGGLASSQGFATGSISFTFDVPVLAVSAYIADASPLGGFNIDLFDDNVFLGTVSTAPRNADTGDDFIGAVSDMAFTIAVFRASDDRDSWGLDDLAFVTSSTMDPVPVPPAALLAAPVLLLLRRRRSQA